MRLNHVFGLLLALALWAEGELAEAAPRTLLHPVQLPGYRGSSLRVAVDLPCGAKLLGLVASEAHARQSLQLAAVVERPLVACAGLLPRVELLVGYLALERYREIAPLPIEPLRARVELVAMQALERHRQGAKAGRLAAVHTPRCGSEVGTFLRQKAGGQVEMAFVERRLAGGAESCPQFSRLTQLDLVARDAGVAFTAFRPRAAPASLQRAYELRLRPVAPAQVRFTPASGSSVAYERACNEAPVGLVVRPLAGGAPGRLGLGVLVAHFPNLRCDGAVQTDVLHERDIDLRAAASLSPLAANGDADLRLAPPRAFAPAQSAQTGGHRLLFIRSCERVLGIVYARDAQGRLAAGVLSQKANSCKSGPSEVSLSQSYVASRVGLKDFVPMRLAGHL